jgi:hypothetical protein
VKRKSLARSRTKLFPSVGRYTVVVREGPVQEQATEPIGPAHVAIVRDFLPLIGAVAGSGALLSVAATYFVMASAPREGVVMHDTAVAYVALTEPQTGAAERVEQRELSPPAQRAHPRFVARPPATPDLPCEQQTWPYIASNCLKAAPPAQQAGPPRPEPGTAMTPDSRVGEVVPQPASGATSLTAAVARSADGGKHPTALQTSGAMTTGAAARLDDNIEMAPPFGYVRVHRHYRGRPTEVSLVPVARDSGR